MAIVVRSFLGGLCIHGRRLGLGGGGAVGSA